MRYCLPVLPSIFHGYRRVFIYYCLQSLIHILTSGAHIVQLSENMWRIYKGPENPGIVLVRRSFIQHLQDVILQTPLVYLETCHLTAPSSQAACCGLPTVTKQGRVFPSQSSGSVNRQAQFWVMRFLPYGHVHLGRWRNFTSILSFFLSEKAAINNSVHQLKKQLGSKGPLGCLGMKGRTHRPLVYIGKEETGRSHCQVDGVSSQY